MGKKTNELDSGADNTQEKLELFKEIFGEREDLTVTIDDFTMEGMIILKGKMEELEIEKSKGEDLSKELSELKESNGEVPDENEKEVKNFHEDDFTKLVDVTKGNVRRVLYMRRDHDSRKEIFSSEIWINDKLVSHQLAM